MHGLISAVAFIAVLVYQADSALHQRRAPNCLKRIPPNLIKQLTEETEKLKNSFKKDVARGEKILPTFCTSCTKSRKPIGTWEVDSLLELYSELVLPRIEDLLPRKDLPRETGILFMEIFARLRHEVRRCQMENSIIPATANTKSIKKTKRKLEKVMRKGESGVSKAVGDFPQILLWISELQVLNHTERE